MSNSLRRNPYYPEIVKLLHVAGYESYTFAQRDSSKFEVIIQTTRGPRNYAFRRTANSFESVPNFKTMFRRFVNELRQDGYLPLPTEPVAPEHKSAQELRLPQNRQAAGLPPLDSRPPASSPHATLSGVAEREDAPRVAPERAETEETRLAPVAPSVPPAPVSAALQEKKMEEKLEPDTALTLAVNAQNISLILEVTRGMTQLVRARPLDDFGQRPQQQQQQRPQQLRFERPQARSFAEPVPVPVPVPAARTKRFRDSVSLISKLRTLISVESSTKEWNKTGVHSRFPEYAESSCTNALSQLEAAKFLRRVGDGVYVRAEE